MTMTASQLQLDLSRRMAKALIMFLRNEWIDVLRDYYPLLSWVQKNCKASPVTLETLIPQGYKDARMTTASIGDPRGEFSYGGEKETKKMASIEWAYMKYWLGYNLIDYIEAGDGEAFLQEKLSDLIKYMAQILNNSIVQGNGTSYDAYGVTSHIIEPVVAGAWNTIGSVNRATTGNEYMRNNYEDSGTAGYAPSRQLLRLIRKAILTLNKNPQGVKNIQGFTASSIMLDIIAYFESLVGSVQYTETLDLSGWMSILLPGGIPLSYDPLLDTASPTLIYFLHPDTFEYAEDMRLNSQAAKSLEGWLEDPNRVEYRKKGVVRFYLRGKDYKASTVIGKVNALAFN